MDGAKIKNLKAESCQESKPVKHRNNGQAMAEHEERGRCGVKVKGIGYWARKYGDKRVECANHKL